MSRPRAAARAAAHLAAEGELAGKFEEGIAVRHALMRAGGLMRAQGEGQAVRPPVAGTTLLFSTVASVVTLSVLIAVFPRL